MIQNDCRGAFSTPEEFSSSFVMFFGDKESISSYALTSDVVIASAGRATIPCLNDVRSSGTTKFKEALMGCRMNNVPVCLIYGKEDLWVTPIWGLQVKRQFPKAPYYQISPVAHCPHDEVPEEKKNSSSEFPSSILTFQAEDSSRYM
uniref:Alpha/beta hydrolase n=2 Tax=Solanum tuberosum TaxID=4113 RepID=M1C4D6_SOLTU